jgi:hypothetical protein
LIYMSDARSAKKLPESAGAALFACSRSRRASFHETGGEKLDVIKTLGRIGG